MKTRSNFFVLLTLVLFITLAGEQAVAQDRVIVELHTFCDGEEREDITCRFYDGAQLLEELESPVILHSFTQRITRITCSDYFQGGTERLYDERIVDYQLGNVYSLDVDIPVQDATIEYSGSEYPVQGPFWTSFLAGDGDTYEDMLVAMGSYWLEPYDSCFQHSASASGSALVGLSGDDPVWDSRGAFSGEISMTVEATSTRCSWPPSLWGEEIFVEIPGTSIYLANFDGDFWPQLRTIKVSGTLNYSELPGQYSRSHDNVCYMQLGGGSDLIWSLNETVDIPYTDYHPKWVGFQPFNRGRVLLDPNETVIIEGSGSWDISGMEITYTPGLPLPSQLPVASFTYSPEEPLIHQTITFDASLSYDPDGTIYWYEWDFGDGHIESTYEPIITITHSYQNPNRYTVILIVHADDYQIGGTLHEIEVSAQYPTASFTYSPEEPLMHQTITFDASSSQDLDGVIVSYEWDFGDGQIRAQSGPVITHRYQNPNSYTVLLTVTDNDGLTDSDSIEIDVIGSPPIAQFTFSPVEPVAGRIVMFDASSSSDADGTIVSYEWGFGDGQTGSSTDPIISHTYQEMGVYTATLTVIDNHALTDSYSSILNVAQPEPPVASFTYSPEEPLAGQTITFDASSSNDPDGTIEWYQWDFGDGQSETSSDFITTHTYQNTNGYTILLTVTDNDGLTASESQSLTIIYPTVYLDINAPDEAEMGSPYFINLEVSVGDPWQGGEVPVVVEEVRGETHAAWDIHDNEYFDLFDLYVAEWIRRPEAACKVYVFDEADGSWVLKDNDYRFGTENILLDIDSGETVLCRLEAYHQWFWIEPWDSTTWRRLVVIGSNLGLDLVRGGPFVDFVWSQIANALGAQREIIYTYNATCQGVQETDFTTVKVPIDKYLLLEDSCISSVIGSVATSAAILRGRIDRGLLSLEVFLMMGARSKYIRASDPPDFNYTEIAEVMIPDLSELDEIDDPNTREATEKTLELAATSKALLTSLERYEGAKIDSSPRFMAMQLEVRKFYAQRMVELTKWLSDFFGPVSTALPIPTPQEIQAIRDELTVNGLPEFEKSILSGFGYTPEDMEEMALTVASLSDEYFTSPGMIKDGLEMLVELAETDNEYIQSIPEILPPELIAYWKLDETEGGIAEDAVGGNDGTLYGAPLWQPTEGKRGGVLALDGAGDYVKSGFVLDPADGAFSVLAWIKGGASGQVVISQADGSAWAGDTWLGLNPVTGELMTGLESLATPSQPLTSESVITDNQWHRIGLVWDGSYRNLYVDGVEVAKDASIQSPLKSANGGLYIGTDKNLNAEAFFTGSVDDVRIYDVALSGDEIEAFSR